MGEFASKGVAGSGLGLGIAGTALGVLAASQNGGGLLGGLFGGGCQQATMGIIAEKDAKIAELTPQMMEQYAPTLKALGVLDAEGKLDIDLLYEEAVKALDKGPVVVAGYRADRGDLDKLKTIMEKYGG